MRNTTGNGGGNGGDERTMGGKLTGAGSVFREFTHFPKCKIFSCTRMGYVTARCCCYCERKDRCGDPCKNDPNKCGMCVMPTKEPEKKKVLYSLDSLDLPDAPDIARAERTGLRPGEVPFDGEDIPCPICGKLAEKFFFDCDGTLFGCDQCVTEKTAEEYDNEKREGGKDEW